MRCGGVIWYNMARSHVVTRWHNRSKDMDKDGKWPSTEDAAAVQTSGAVLKVAIDEEWSEERHRAEFRRLVAKSAANDITPREVKRLEKLQAMRRETLPLAVSYEEFIMDMERQRRLDQLLDMIEEYKKDFGHAGHGRKEIR